MEPFLIKDSKNRKLQSGFLLFANKHVNLQDYK